ncbi:hypothetical protein KIH27_07950 [Mycobacterium sp. M1]|uniref:PE domain-containing protein n=1 Tax=Mycolicibacter acidiphilus TaxID=2835306 RepID=A0ABS5RH63_9MYCO|nr:hypothetical protein [Mycolicibacter acidiphilus]MBS9533519.1 hypothetical protein [Mycolicibacter acidiphilus]
MQSVPHSHLAAAALTAGSLIAAVPAVASFPSNVAIELTAESSSLLQQILDSQLSAFNTLVNGDNGMLDSNAALVTSQAQLIQDYLDATGVAPGEDQTFGTQLLDHFFDGSNALLGANQGALLGLLGARADFDPQTLNASLLSPTDSGFNYFGGIEQAFGQYAAYFSQNSLLPGGSGDSATLGALFGTLVDDMYSFNTSLISAEEAFNASLVSNEIAMEQAAFGSDSAFNGAVNRAFNAYNMMFDAQQQSLNNFIGAGTYTPQDLTQTLLTGSPGDHVFNDGSIGGLTGSFDQNLAMFADLAGLQPSDWAGLSANFDSPAFTTAFNDFLTTVSGGPFGDVFGTGLTPIFTDFTNIFDALSGASG